MGELIAYFIVKERYVYHAPQIACYLAERDRDITFQAPTRVDHLRSSVLSPSYYCGCSFKYKNDNTLRST